MSNYPLHISERGIKFIKDQEFFVPNTYLDSAGIPTLGYGSTRWASGRKVQMGETITVQTAHDLLLSDVNKKIAAIQPLIKQPLTQNQQDAIISLFYNIGTGGFATSTVLRLLNVNPNDPKIEDAFMMWTKITFNGKKKELPGLVNRRRAEYKIYKS